MEIEIRAYKENRLFSKAVLRAVMDDELSSRCSLLIKWARTFKEGVTHFIFILDKKETTFHTKKELLSFLEKLRGSYKKESPVMLDDLLVVRGQLEPARTTLKSLKSTKTRSKKLRASIKTQEENIEILKEKEKELLKTFPNLSIKTTGKSHSYKLIEKVYEKYTCYLGFKTIVYKVLDKKDVVLVAVFGKEIKENVFFSLCKPTLRTYAIRAENALVYQENFIKKVVVAVGGKDYESLERMCVDMAGSSELVEYINKLKKYGPKEKFAIKEALDNKNYSFLQ